MTLDAVLVPAELRPARLRARTAAVFDVLRATTTAVAALAHGARAVVPVARLDDARRLARRLARREPVLLAGERGALPPAGFDLGNSPADMAPERVAGRTLVLCTTNGTAALERCRRAGAEPVYAAAFVNASAVAAALAASLAAGRGAVLVCAGRRGEVALEDVLAAGCVVERVLRHLQETDLSDAARLALAAWERARDRWPETLHESAHARHLERLGFAADLQLAARLDVLDVVPRLRRGRLVTR